MNNQVIADSASDLFKAMRSRWRTGGTQASMTLSQAHPGAESSYAGRRARPRSLSESSSTGVVIDESTYDCPFCRSFMSAREYGNAFCESCNRSLEESDHRFITMKDCLDAFNEGWKASGIKDKNEYIRLEFVNQEKDYVRRTGTLDDYSRRVIYGESLQESSGQAANPEVPDYDPNSPEPRFLQIAKAELLRRRDLKCRDCGFTGLPASVDGNCPECGGLMNEPELQMTTAASTADQIRAAIRQQVADKKQGLKRDNSTNESRKDFEYHSFVYHPRVGFLHGQDTHAAIAKRGGLTAHEYDQSHRGGYMVHEDHVEIDAISGPDDREVPIHGPGMSYQRLVDHLSRRYPGRVVEETEESVHASVPNHQHDIHLSDLVTHYGFKASGDHYVVPGDSDSRLYVHSNGKWIHKHHGVHHEGHGHKSLSAHLSRYGNHRSER